MFAGAAAAAATLALAKKRAKVVMMSGMKGERGLGPNGGHLS